MPAWPGDSSSALPHLLQGAILPTVIFSDSLATTSSTLNGSTNSPSSTSTNYNIASALAATSSINAGALKMNMPTTKSGLTEAQAFFTSTPVSLSNIGSDEIELTVTFTNVAGVAATNAKSGVYFGLFNSGGSAPYNTLQTTGLTSSATAQATGGVQNWLGYVGQSFAPAGIPKVITRPAQTSNNNTNQDLLDDGVSATQGYHTPTGDPISTADTPQTLGLTAGNQYTADLLIALTGVNTYTITSTLYPGATDSGTPVSSSSGTNTLPADFLTTSFDSMAIGWRYSSSVSAASEMDINSVTVSASVPEPATLGLAGMAAVTLLHRRRRNGRE